MKPADHYNGIAIITCRNGLTYTKACLKSLLEQDHQPLLILAVDNASTDGTPAWLKAQQHGNPNLMRITFAEVVSVAHMWNEALRAAWAMGFDEALVVNNDTELLPETHRELSKAKESHLGIGITTAIGRTAKGDLVYGEPPPLRDNPDFSCFLIRRFAWEAVDGFDEQYLRAYGEDCEMHVRLHRAGIRAVCTGLPFLHHLSGTLKSSSDKAEIQGIQRQADLNREHFYQKWGKRIGTKGYEELFTPETFGITSAARASASTGASADPPAPSA